MGCRYCYDNQMSRGNLPPLVVCRAIVFLSLFSKGLFMWDCAADVATNASVTLQARIDAAAPGDTISVPPGFFLESLLFNKDIILIGAGATNTIIDGGTNGPTLLVTSSATAILRNLTVQGGRLEEDLRVLAGMK